MKKISTLFLVLVLALDAYCQNVGIGTTTPATKLHVVGTGSNIATFSGGGSMYITLAEGVNNRGYIGSFAGNAEDVDFGTYSGNATGKIHLTIQDIPKFTLTPAGNIGIGELNPTVPLNFTSILGNKISLWGTATNHYGLGIQNNQMQMYTPSSGDDITFGTGNSAAFTENVRFKGNGSVGIGNAPAASAVLDVASNSKGVVLPRLTTEQREAIATPATGLLVFDISYSLLFIFDGYKWMAMKATDPADLKWATQTPADANANEFFGACTGIDSLYAIVGAPYQNGAVGAAYIYKKTNNVWAQMTKLIPDVSSYQLFGSSVSIDFPYAVVGAPEYNGSQGSLYIFYFNGSAWVQLNKFLKPGTVETTQFGYAVDIDNNFIVVGAPSANNIAALGGAVFTYKLNAGVWSYHNTLTHGSIAAGNSFGYAVAVSDSFIVIGSPSYDNGIAIDEGIAYKFKLNNGGTWAYQQTLFPIYNTDYYTPPTWGTIEAVKPNWKYKKFGNSVDIKYNNSGLIGAHKIITVVGAPESYFKFNSTQSAVNLGIVNVFAGSNSSISDNKILAMLHNYQLSDVPNINDKNVYYGASVSLSAYKGNLAIDTAQIALQLLIGAPGNNNGKGLVERRIIIKGIAINSYLAGGSGETIYTFEWNNNYGSGLLSSYTENMNNAQTGFDCSIFDANSYIVSLPGLNTNKGGIIFKF